MLGVRRWKMVAMSVVDEESTLFWTLHPLHSYAVQEYAKR